MTTCKINYTPNVISNNDCCIVDVDISGESQKNVSITLENGQVISGAFFDKDTTYSLSFNNGNLIFTPSVGSPTVINIVNNLISSNPNNLVILGSDGKLFVDDNTTTIINNPAGHRIASYINENTAQFDINETVTEITSASLNGANLLEINYRNENGVSNTTSVSLATLAADVKVLSLQYDAVNNKIVITNTDGTTSEVQLTDIIDVITNTLTVTGNTIESTINGISSNASIIGGVNLSKVGTNLEISINGVTANIPLSQIADGSETKVTAGANVVVTGSGTSGSPYIISSSAAPDGSETKVTAGLNTTVTGTGTVASPYVISSAALADGSETKIDAGANVSITGIGTTASPYIINSTATADGSETKVTAGLNTVITGTGTVASPYVINSASDQYTALIQAAPANGSTLVLPRSNETYINTALTAANSFTIGLAAPLDAYVNEYIVVFKTGATAPTIIQPAGVVWRCFTPLISANETWTIVYEKVKTSNTPTYETYAIAMKNV